jgi:hypothetical protein
MRVKRIMLAKEIPPIKDGVVSASKSPETETGRFAETCQILILSFSMGIKRNSRVCCLRFCDESIAK